MRVPVAVLASLAPGSVRVGLRGSPPTCRLCGSPDTRPVCVSSGAPGLSVAVCAACGITFTAGSAEIARSRARYDVYWAEISPDAICRTDLFTASRRRYLERQLGCSCDGLRVLEVGMGRGEFARELLDHGARVTGVEADARMAELVGRRLGIVVHRKLLEDFDPGPERYDVVNLSHVLEHIGDPIAALRRAAELLAPGGAISIEVPNADVVAGGRLERFFFDEVTHLFHFTARTLERVAAAAGLTLRGAEAADDSWWGRDCALRAVAARTGAVYAGAAHPLEHAPAGEADETVRHMLAEQAAWRLYRRHVREARTQVGRVAKRVLPATVVDRLRALRF